MRAAQTSPCAPPGTSTYSCITLELFLCFFSALLEAGDPSCNPSTVNKTRPALEPARLLTQSNGLPYSSLFRTLRRVLHLYEHYYVDCCSVQMVMYPSVYAGLTTTDMGEKAGLSFVWTNTDSIP